MKHTKKKRHQSERILNPDNLGAWVLVRLGHGSTRPEGTRYTPLEACTNPLKPKRSGFQACVYFCKKNNNKVAFFFFFPSGEQSSLNRRPLAETLCEECTSCSTTCFVQPLAGVAQHLVRDELVVHRPTGTALLQPSSPKQTPQYSLC